MRMVLREKTIVMSMFVILVLILLPVTVNAQKPWKTGKILQDYITFRNIPIEYSSRPVYATLQDSRGMMWIATSKGIYSYNGYNLHGYGLNLNVQSLCQIDDRHLCLGTMKGIFFLDIFTGKVVPPYPRLQHLSMIRRLRIYRNILWIASDADGLLSFNISTRHLTRWLNHGRKENITYAILPVKDKIYFGSLDGFSMLDLRTMRRQRVTCFPKKTGILSLLWYAPEHCVYIGTEGQLYTYYPGLHRTVACKKFPHNVVKDMILDNKGNLIMGTDAGLLTYNFKRKRYHLLLHDARSSRSIINNVVWNVNRDKEHNLWLSTNTGVTIMNNEHRFFLNNLTDIFDSGEGETFSRMLVDHKGRVWMGGDNGLVMTVIRHNMPDRFYWYNTNNPQYILHHNRVRDIYEDRQHTVWIASDASIAYYDEKKHQFHYFVLTTSDNRNANWSYAVYEDHYGRLWISNFNCGVIIVDKKQLMSSALKGTYHVKKLYEKLDALKGENTIRQIIPDDSGHIWLMRGNEMIRIDEKTLRMKVFPISQTQVCYCKNALWLIQGPKVCRFDIKKEKLQTISENKLYDEFRSMIVKGNYIWLSSPDGCYQINIARRSIRYMAGLPLGNFLCGNYQPAMGMVLWGGESQLLFFSPSHYRYSSPPVVISTVIKEKKTKGGQESTTCSLEPDKREIDIDNGASITLELSTLSYDLDKNEIFYYQIGDEASWHRLPVGENRLNFMNVSSSSYKLRLSTSNPTIDPHARITTYVLNVPPPWYSSWPMILVYFILAVAAIYLLLKRQQFKNRKKMELREREKTLELSQMKTGFLVNMSHELETPLSLVVSPLSKLLQSSRDSSEREILRAVQENALKLHTVIEKIINISSTRKEDMDTLLRSHVEINQLLKNCINVFASTIEQRNLTVTYSSAAKTVWMNIDSQKIASAVTNILSNAINYVEDGTGKISVRMTTGADMLTISVSDNGPGVPEEERQMIFLRFFQGKNPIKHQGGIGIGLYLARKFVEQHGGSLNVESMQGACFTIQLPLTGDNILKDEEEPTGVSVYPQELRQDMGENINIEKTAKSESVPVRNIFSADEVLMEEITQLIEDNMASEDFNVSMLAKKLGMEQKTLYRKVKQLVGMSPIAYLKELRMKKAALLLENRQFTISEVMYMVGYSNASYFARCFSEKFCMTPKQYREQQ